jgi:hypothetical protein
MQIEELARDMRIAALDGYRILTGLEVIELRQELQKLYFNAGRWAGGAKDYTARNAFETLNKIEAINAAS